MNKSIAQHILLGNIDGIGPLSTNAHSATAAYTQLDRLVSNVIGVLTLIAGVYFLIQLVLGGYSWMSSGGDKQSTQLAQKKLTGAVIGLFLVIAGYILAGIIGNLLGLNISLFGTTLQGLTP